MLDSGLQDQGADGLPRHLHEDTRGGVDIAVLVPIEQWKKMERMTRPDLKELLLASEARTEDITPPRRRRRRTPPVVD